MLSAWVEQAFVRAGLSATDASHAAEPLVLSDSMGVYTHGTKLLPGYLKKLVAGGSKPDARPRIVRQGLACSRGPACAVWRPALR
jgi:LDH2 family malate/lactate/ureidoglycolate dehydrogenase